MTEKHGENTSFPSQQNFCIIFKEHIDKILAFTFYLFMAPSKCFCQCLYL